MTAWGLRYLALLVCALIFLHITLNFTLRNESHDTLERLFDKLSPLGGNSTESSTAPSTADPTLSLTFSNSSRRANATMLMLARNSDLDGAIQSIRSIEDRFNNKFGYPWVFLNDEPFDTNFISRVKNVISSPVSFGVIPREHWVQPEWIDEERATAARAQLESQGVIYGGSVPYRNMCRFNSGFFYRHTLLQRYQWYWRVEPDVKFHCDMNYDPFTYMETQNKLYGFTIVLYEFWATVPNLWSTVQEFLKAHPHHYHPESAMDLISDDGGASYNMCHFWSNFEIANMDIWRSQAYTDYFNFLDASGGFYYERWGDAPVHSIAASLFIPKDQLHFFGDIGYEHPPNTHCPRDKEQWEAGRCSCDPSDNFDYGPYSCRRKWDALEEASQRLNVTVSTI